jgi:hypothetical protein
MHDIFGRWLDDVVRILTNVALDTETSIDQVKHARKDTARGGGVLKLQKPDPVRPLSRLQIWLNAHDQTAPLRHAFGDFHGTGLRGPTENCCQLFPD